MDYTLDTALVYIESAESDLRAARDLIEEFQAAYEELMAERGLKDSK